MNARSKMAQAMREFRSQGNEGRHKAKIMKLAHQEYGIELSDYDEVCKILTECESEQGETP